MQRSIVAVSFLGALATSLACGGDMPWDAPTPESITFPAVIDGSTSGASAATTIRPFEPAPPLGTVEWVKGDAPDLSHGVAVVEHWATWCGPCRAEFPHLSHLADTHPDVVFASISDEPASTVRPFVTRKNDEMRFRVGASDPTSVGRWSSWSGASGIPHAYVLTDGQIVWNGHPQGLDDVLAPVIAGTWTPEVAARYEALDADHDAYLRSATAGTPDASLGSTFEEAWVPASSQNNLAWAILTELPAERRDLQLALRLSTSACEKTGRQNYGYEDTYALALYETGDHATALAVQREAVRRCDEIGNGDCGELRERLVRFGG